MIRLLLFVACEKVIVGEGDRRASLIDLIEGISIAGDALEGGIPKNAVLPSPWTAVSLWHRTQKVNKPINYEARVQIITPKGKVMPEFTIVVPFVVSNSYTNFRNTFSFNGLPIGEEGFYHFDLSYRKKGSKNWTKAGDYPMNIQHTISNENELKKATRPLAVFGKTAKK